MDGIRLALERRGVVFHLAWGCQTPLFFKPPFGGPQHEWLSFRGDLMKRILCLSLLLVASIAGLAQGTTSRIAGVVTDASGALVAGASVTAIREGTNATYSMTTGSKGEYVFDSVQLGKNTVRETLASFKTYVSPG